jgi:putative membrane protein
VSESNDPRVYFAAERTLLAWLRTGLTVIGLGFVVARFGLFLRMLHHEDPMPAVNLTSTLLGVGLVLLGSVATALAAWQHVRFCRELSPAEKPPCYWTGHGVWFAFTLATLGIILATHLLIRSALG